VRLQLVANDQIKAGARPGTLLGRALQENANHDQNTQFSPMEKPKKRVRPAKQIGGYRVTAASQL